MKKSITDEAAIISGLQAGGTQRRFFERKLYEYFFYLIKHGVKKYKLREDEGASAYSDTIISVIENIVMHRYEGRASLKSFTYQIFMNKCVDIVRKKTTHKSMVNHKIEKLDLLINTLPDNARNIIEQMMKESDQSLLMQKVRELGQKCQQLLLLFEDGYSDKDIAHQMQYNSAEVVKTTRLRCLEKLREKVFSKKSSDD